MARDLQFRPAGSPSLLRRGLALVILAAVAVLAVHLVVGLIMTVVWVVIGVVALAAVLWAANQLL